MSRWRTWGEIPTFMKNDFTLKYYRHLIADDGRIREDKVYHDSWSSSYRVPFEAVKEGTPVKLSLATGKGDVTSAKLVVYKAKITANGGDEYNPDYTAGTVTSYPMTKVSTSGDQDIWKRLSSIWSRISGSSIAPKLPEMVGSWSFVRNV